MKSSKTKKILKTIIIIFVVLFVCSIIVLIINSFNVINGTPIREIILDESGVVFE